MYAPQTTRHSRRRSGFSMVELLMVVVIILILMGLLLVGVNGAMARARVVAATVEISNLDKAIKDFKLQYGVEPPSYLIIYEDAAEWTNATPSEPSAIAAAQRTQLRSVSRSSIRSIWPDYEFGTDIDVNGDGDATDFWVLNGAECLVFFLGGVADLQDLDGDGSADDFVPSGFSANPEFPFALGGTRVGPFYQFDPARLVDVEQPADGIPEFLDNLPGQVTPLQYFSSYDGTGYRARGLNGAYDGAGAADGISDDECLPGGLVTQYIMVNSAPAGSPPTPSSPQTSWNPTSFQIISPGVDTNFGLGGVYNNNNQLTPDGADYGLSIPRSVVDERDNITNFKGGRLN